MRPGVKERNGMCQCTQRPYMIVLKVIVFIEVLRLKYITLVFALGKVPQTPLSLFHYTVWKIYRLIFNDCLLMFNEEIQSALCKFHPLFHYRNLSYVNVGRRRKAAV